MKNLRGSLLLLPPRTRQAAETRQPPARVASPSSLWRILTSLDQGSENTRLDSIDKVCHTQHTKIPPITPKKKGVQFIQAVLPLKIPIARQSH